MKKWNAPEIAALDLNMTQNGTACGAVETETEHSHTKGELLALEYGWASCHFNEQNSTTSADETSQQS